MSVFWRNWLAVWTLAVGGTGLILAGAAIEASSGLAQVFFGLLNGPAEFRLDIQSRFTLGVLGAVMLGWSLTLWAAISAAHLLGERGRPVWKMITAGTLLWFVVDTALSIVTGYTMNAVLNVVFLVGLLVPIVASGVLVRR